LRAVPEIPTFAESYPGFEANASWNFFAPAGTPKEIITKLNTEMVKILRSPEVVQRLSEGGLEAVGSTPKELATRMRSDREKWDRVIKKLNLKTE
jgi:tripartite-type tricarboxylate transporter receptor subunit TctC